MPTRTPPVRYVEFVDVLGLDHVQVAAPRGNEAEARSFFGGLLGLSEVQKPDALRSRGGVWFKLGEQELHDEALPGARRFYTEDPWGNRIELLSVE